MQVPIYEQRNDGRDNLLGALVIAGHYVIPEVSDAKTQDPEIIVRQSFSLQLPPKNFLSTKSNAGKKSLTEIIRLKIHCLLDSSFKLWIL